MRFPDKTTLLCPPPALSKHPANRQEQEQQNQWDIGGECPAVNLPAWINEVQVQRQECVSQIKPHCFACCRAALDKISGLNHFPSNRQMLLKPDRQRCENKSEKEKWRRAKQIFSCEAFPLPPCASNQDY